MSSLASMLRGRETLADLLVALGAGWWLMTGVDVTGGLFYASGSKALGIIFSLITIGLAGVGAMLALAATSSSAGSAGSAGRSARVPVSALIGVAVVLAGIGSLVNFAALNLGLNY